ncbi:MAG: hypothetical protein Ct9H300mP12_16490 [Acidimicrobiales bacterium]|nr:MAG: hypothetical protein Ct9H300mP12_16490 [Acidimicrobiales bacterium]
MAPLCVEAPRRYDLRRVHRRFPTRRGLCPRLLCSVPVVVGTGRRTADEKVVATSGWSPEIVVASGGHRRQEGEMAVTDRIDALAAPLCDPVGVELVDVEYEGGVVA